MHTHKCKKKQNKILLQPLAVMRTWQSQDVCALSRHCELCKQSSWRTSGPEPRTQPLHHTATHTHTHTHITHAYTYTHHTCIYIHTSHMHIHTYAHHDTYIHTTWRVFVVVLVGGSECTCRMSRTNA